MKKGEFSLPLAGVTNEDIEKMCFAICCFRPRSFAGRRQSEHKRLTTKSQMAKHEASNIEAPKSHPDHLILKKTLADSDIQVLSLVHTVAATLNWDS